jgi:nucleotide-binding universal stress UspA family protein
VKKISIFPTKILLATDGSKQATLAAKTALDIAEKTNSELHIVHVTAPLHHPGYYEGLYESPSTEGIAEMMVNLQLEQEELERRAQRLLDEQVEKVKAAGGSLAQAHLRIGRPDEEVVALAEEIGAGLIAMGSRGLGGVRRALMGSVSDSVVRHAHCPVLVVRAEKGG